MVPSIDWKSLTLSQEHRTAQEGFSGMAGSPCCHACERKKEGIVEEFTNSQLQIYMKSARRLAGSNAERSSLQGLGWSEYQYTT